jgi:lambda family phage minor tail protein L
MTTPQSIQVEINKLAPSAVIELFELDGSDVGLPDILRFHSGTNELRQNIIWQGETYVRFPLEASGFEISGQGQVPRPKLKVSNHLSIITSYLLQYGDLTGAKFTRKRTLKRYLDAVNFEGGVNLDADPDAAFPDDVFFIDRKATENRDFVEFELASSMDLAGVGLPRRQIIQNLCPWRYRGSECGYTGEDYFLSDDTVTTEESLDICGKRLASCKKRFGTNAELPFGGFPGAGLFR